MFSASNYRWTKVIESNKVQEKIVKIIEYNKPTERSDCKIIEEENINQLVDLLSSEAKVI